MEFLGVGVFSVEENGTCEHLVGLGSRLDSPGENVQERGLTGTRGTDDGDHLTLATSAKDKATRLQCKGRYRCDITGDIVQDGLEIAITTASGKAAFFLKNVRKRECKR